MDPKSFTVGAFVGLLAGELLKQIISYFFKRTGEKSSEKKKLIRAELSDLETKCLEIMNLSVEYYGLPTNNDEAKKISKALKNLFREVGAKLVATNVQMVEHDLGRIEMHLWTDLKRVTSDQLDVSRPIKLPDDDQRFDLISRSSMRLHARLHKLKHKCV